MVRFSDVLLEKELHSDSLIHLWNDHLRVFNTDLTRIPLLQLLPTIRRICLFVFSWSVTFDIIKAPGNRKQEAAWRPLTMLVTFFFFFGSFTWVRLSNSTQTEQRPSAARTETDGRNILTSVFRVSRFHRGRSEVKPINNRNLWPGNEVWLNPLPVKTKTDVRLTTKWRRTSAVLWFWILVLIFLYPTRQQLCLIAFCTPGVKQPLIKVQIQNQQEFEDQHCDPQC